MKHFPTIEKSDMEHILTGLQELDLLYHSESLSIYEQAWVRVAQQVQDTFPGFTIAYAELYTTNTERDAHGGMRHVLVPHSEPLANCWLVC